MSVRLYVGNLPQSFDTKELEALFASVGEGIRFKAVQDRETGAGRGKSVFYLIDQRCGAGTDSFKDVVGQFFISKINDRLKQ